MLRCEELREVELKNDVSICGLEHGEILGEEINEEDLMNYWDSSEESKDVLVEEADQAMKPCIFKSHSLCMFVGCAKDGEKSSETVTEKNETLKMNFDEEIINEFLVGVRYPVEVVMA